MSFISLSCKKKKKNNISQKKKSDKIANLFSIYKNFILKVNINEQKKIAHKHYLN